MNNANKVTRNDLDTLLAHILRCPTIMAQASERLAPEDFDEATELPHKLIWNIARKFYQDNNKALIPMPYLINKIKDMALEIPMLADEHIFASVAWAVHNSYTAIPDRDLIPEAALRIMSDLLFERRIVSEFCEVLNQGNMSHEHWDQLNQKALQNRVSGPRIVNPFGEGFSEKICITPRMSTGIPFMNVLLGGGIRPREAFGFLAPSGGGKTTLSNQLAIAFARTRHHIGVFTYEEPITDEYLQPIWACAAQIPRSVLDKIKDFKELPADMYRRVMEAREVISNYLHIIDMSGSQGAGSGRGGVPEIESVLIDYEQRGIKLEAFIIDWFWPMFKRWSSSVTTSRNVTTQERTLAQDCSDSVKQLCNRHNCWGWINQQASPSEAKKKGKMQQQDAAEFKSFSWYLNGCVTLNTLDENNCTGTLNYSKARSAKRGDITIKLNGEIATFEPLGDDLSYDHLQHKVVAKKDYNKVPRERKPVQPNDPSSLERNYAG